MAANRGICSIDIASDTVGFFGQLSWCLYICRYCEAKDLLPDIRLSGEIYRDPARGSNWLDYYFDWTRAIAPDEILRRVRYTKEIADFAELGPPIAPAMSIEDGARVFRKYLRPKPHIAAQVEEVWRRIGAAGDVVGVHFRGTDKTSEASRVSWQHCLAVVRTHLRANPAARAVFVSSDEQGFVEFLAASVHEVPVHFRADHSRSVDGKPVHISSGSGYEKGEDALVNALLLSKCASLIRTTSRLSAWASLFNPELKVVLLNRPYAGSLWYPEGEILRRRTTEYRPDAPVPALALEADR